MVCTRGPKLLQAPFQLQHVFKMDFRLGSQTPRMRAMNFRRAEMEIQLHRPDQVVSPFPTRFSFHPLRILHFCLQGCTVPMCLSCRVMKIE